MDSKRQKIVAAVIDRMKEISTGAGYQTDIGATVADWETDFDESDLPAIVVMDTVADVELVGGQPPASNQIYRLPVLIRVFLRSTDSAREARRMLADINRAVGVDRFWTSEGVQLAMWTRPLKEGIVPAENFEINGAAVELEIAYITESFNSYQ